MQHTVPPAKLAGQRAVRSTRTQSLDRQDRLGSLLGQIDIKGVDVEREHSVKPHEHGQLCQTLDTKLLQSLLVYALADAMCAIKLLTVLDYGSLFGLHWWERFFV